MQNVEKRIITAVIKAARVAGFVPVKFWDGGDYQTVAYQASDATLKRTIVSAISAVDSVDMGTLHFAPVTDLNAWGTHGVLLVLGNGIDVISDWHCQTEAFDAAIESVSSKSEDYA